MNMRMKLIIQKDWLLFKRSGATSWTLLGLFLTLGIQLIYIHNDVETSKVVGAFAALLLSFGFITAASPMAVAEEKESGTLEVLLTEATNREVFLAKIIFVSAIPLVVTTVSFVISMLTMLFTGIWAEAIIFYASVYLTILTFAILSVMTSAKSKSVVDAFQSSRQAFVLPAILVTAVISAMVDAPELIALPFLFQVVLFAVIYRIGMRRFEDVERLIYS